MVKRKVRCVCSLVNKLALFYGHNLQGEIFFKHALKCKSKSSGTYEWTGSGYEKKGETNM